MANSTPAGAQPPATHPTALSKALSTDLRAYWLLWLIVAFGIFVRVYKIHILPGMHGDEAWYGIQSQRLLAGEAVSWRTPTGNVPGILHLGSLSLLHAIFSPSLLLLRIPSLVSSIGALVLAYAVGRRFFGQTAGMVALVLMASLPINIAYARLGWDPSHSPLLILACAYAAFAGRKLLCALLFALALSNHPSAVFVAPFITLGFLGFRGGSQEWRGPILETLQLVVLLLLAILLVIAISPSTTHYVSISGAVSRLFDPSGWSRFGLMFCRLISGDTTYSYAIGVGLAGLRNAADWLVGAGLTVVAIAGIAHAWRRSDWPLAGLLAGLTFSLALLYIVAGTWVLNPKYERFSFPMVPILALTVAALLNDLSLDRRWVQPIAGLICLSLLAGFWFHYIAPLEQGRYRQVKGFWTSAEDPARIVLQRISGDAGMSSGTRIIAEDWWLQGPIAYYAVGGPFETLDARKLPPLQDMPKTDKNYWVTFNGRPLDRALAGRTDVRLRWAIATTNPDDKVNIWQGTGR